MCLLRLYRYNWICDYFLFSKFFCSIYRQYLSNYSRTIHGDDFEIQMGVNQCCQKIKNHREILQSKFVKVFFFPSLSLPASDLILRPALNLDHVSSCQRSVSCFCSCWVRFYSTSSGKQCLSKKHFKRLQHLVALSTKRFWSVVIHFFWSGSFGENVWLQREVVMFKNHFQMFLKMIRMSKVIKYAKIIILIA